MRKRRLRSLLAALAAAALTAIAAGPAQAAFPGPNGRIAFADFYSGNIYSVNPNGSALTQLTQSGPTRANANPSWSPVGDRIVFERFRTDSSHDQARIWIMDADGDNERRVAGVQRPLRDLAPAFTPDGSRIVFTRCRGQDPCAIWEMRLDGTGQRPLTPFVGGDNITVDFDPAVSPDGESIAFTRFVADGFLARIFVIDADGANPHPVTPPSLEGFGPDWSPDGERITFSSNAFRLGSRVYTMAADGSDLQPITGVAYPNNDIFPVYSPRGHRLAYSSDRPYPDICCLDLFTIAPDGTALRRVDLGLDPWGVVQPSWGSAPLE